MARLVEGVNDLATLRPDILEFWDYAENKKHGIYPDKVTCNSGKSAYFKCVKCGRTFDRHINQRVKGKDRCRVCTSKEVITGVNDIATTHPHWLKYWDYTENDKRGLDPTKLMAGSGKGAYFICQKCGKSYFNKYVIILMNVIYVNFVLEKKSLLV